MTAPRKKGRGGLRSPAGGRPKSEDGPGKAIMLKFPQRHLGALGESAKAMGLPISTACVRLILQALRSKT